MNLSILELFKAYEEINISFQQYLLRVTNGNGNFREFATQLSFRMQLGMLLEYLEDVYSICICIVPNGGMVCKIINDRQYCVEIYTCEVNTNVLIRYYNTIDKALSYIIKPF